MNNNNNVNTNTQASVASSSLETSEFGNNNNTNIDSIEVHGLQQQTQHTPLVQHLLDNTSITIEENTTGGHIINLNNLDFDTNVTTHNNRANIMEQYARYLRQQVAEVTRGGLSNIIAVSTRSRSNSVTAPTRDNFARRIRYIPAPLAGDVLNRVLTADNRTVVPSQQHSNESNASNNQVMIALAEHDSGSRIILPNAPRLVTGRTAVASDNHAHTLAAYFQNQTSDSSSNTSSIPTNQTISSRVRLLEEDSGGARSSLVERASSLAGANAASSDATTNATRGSNTELSDAATNDLHNNVYPDIFINTIRQCLHYIPFACILLLKFIYDHFTGLLDLIILQFSMYAVNKSLQVQVARIEDKKNSILLRDLTLVVAIISLRLLIASTPPDPFGLLIAPTIDERNIAHQITFNFPQDTNNNNHVPASLHSNQISSTAQATVDGTATTTSPATTTIFIPKIISLVALLYYIAVNDLILKLITISIKLVVTLLPLRSIRQKSRTRLYVFIELFSQFYRSLVPIRQWLLFLFESYSGLHAISGVMFSSAYIVLKGCELTDRGKALRKSFFNLVKDVDKSRKPIPNELDAADELCAICQDSYVSPVVLECGHIFCDNCVTTWFKREQTCPMCRAKVGENLAWHDGSTTFFYQLY